VERRLVMRGRRARNDEEEWIAMTGRGLDKRRFYAIVIQVPVNR